MTTARELHKMYSEYGIRTDLGSPNQTLILRALDLLVAVEESEYEMVLDLLAAARIVAQDERIAKLEAERDKLKARWFADDDPKETEYAAEFDAYRRDFRRVPV